MNSRQIVDLETQFESIFGLEAGGQFWRAQVPLIRMAFSDEENAVVRVETAWRVSEEVLSAVFSGFETDIRLTLWKNVSPAFGDQLASLAELEGLGVHEVLGQSETEMATIVYALIRQFRTTEVRELFLRIYRAEMGLSPSLQASLVLWKLKPQPIALYVSDDRGLDIITTDSLLAKSISAKFAQFVYQATSP